MVTMQASHLFFSFLFFVCMVSVDVVALCFYEGYTVLSEMWPASPWLLDILVSSQRPSSAYEHCSSSSAHLSLSSFVPSPQTATPHSLSFLPRCSERNQYSLYLFSFFSLLILEKSNNISSYFLNSNFNNNFFLSVLVA